MPINFKDNLLRGSTVLFIGSMAGNICNYLFQFFMSRRLSVADFGAMNSLFSFMVILAVPSMAILLIAAKQVSAFKVKNELHKIKLFRKKVFKELIKYGLIILLPMLALSPFIAEYLKINSSIPVTIIFLVIFFSFLQPVNAGIIQGLQRFISLGILGAFGGFAKIFFSVLLIIAGLRLNGALLGILLSAIAGLIFSFYYLRDIPDVNIETDDLGIGYKNILSAAMPVIICTLGIMGLTNLDLILVKHYFPEAQAGIYAAIAVLGRTIFFFPGIIVTAMFPMVSENHAREADSFPLLMKALFYTVLMAGAGTGILCISPELMLKMLFGNKYAEGASLLRIFSLAMFFMATVNILSNFFLAIEKKYFLIVILAGCALEAGLIAVFHNSLISVLIILCSTTSLVFICLLFLACRLRLSNKTIEHISPSCHQELQLPNV
ncbi:MAG: oligosaccharide flippase family protein [Pseudomonadota bacterium]